MRLGYTWLGVVLAGLMLAKQACALNVEISARLDGSGKPDIVGITNLPDGTLLMLTLSDRRYNYSAQAKVDVKGGKFRGGPFSLGKDDLPSGSYEIEVMTPLVEVQPSEVLPVFGKEGSKLQGPLVKPSSIGQGKIATYRKVLNIGP